MAVVSTFENVTVINKKKKHLNNLSSSNSNSSHVQFFYTLEVKTHVSNIVVT
jgi:hypothetical protein